jgi:hypothetical protein
MASAATFAIAAQRRGLAGGAGRPTLVAAVVDVWPISSGVAFVRQCVTDLLTSGLSAATTRKAVFALRQCLDAAIADNRRQFNPATAVPGPWRTRSSRGRPSTATTQSPTFRPESPDSSLLITMPRSDQWGALGNVTVPSAGNIPRANRTQPREAMIAKATSSGTAAQRGRFGRMLAQPGQDDCLMRPGHLRWTLGGMTPSGYSGLRRPECIERPRPSPPHRTGRLAPVFAMTTLLR